MGKISIIGLFDARRGAVIRLQLGQPGLVIDRPDRALMARCRSRVPASSRRSVRKIAEHSFAAKAYNAHFLIGEHCGDQLPGA